MPVAKGVLAVYECPACKVKLDYITTIHMKTHGCESKQEFLQKYGEPEQKFILGTTA